MASNFALSLAPDGLRLLHRVEGGWAFVGEIPGGAADLASALARLRRQAERIEPGGLRTKLLIPNDQIRYVALDGARATDDEIRTALKGATPYDVDELVWDTARGGGRTYVAAVARETLEEAESFAVSHGFGPVSFAAVPAPFTFRGEAYFGPTSVAGADGDSRDARPVAIVADAPAPPGEERPADLPAAAPSSEEARDPAPGVEPEPSAAVDDRSADPEGETSVPNDTFAPDEEAEAPTPPPPPMRQPLAAEASVSFASRARVVREVARTAPPPLARRLATEGSDGSASFVSRREEPVLRSASGPRPGPHEAAAPRLGAAERPAAAMPRPFPAPSREPTSPVSPLARSGAPMVQGTATPADSDSATPAAAAATLDPIPPLPEPFGRGRAGQKGEADADALERDRMSAFGERNGARRTGGKPRFLGLILSVLLLLAMAAVAVWATDEAPLSAWFGGDDEPAETEVAAVPSLEPAPADVSDLLPPPPEMSADAADVPVAEPDPEPPGTVVAPAEAERFYAATGVWIRGARLPLRPRSETFELPVSVVTRPAQLPEEPVTDELAMLVPDIGLGKQPVPPPAGTVFARDDRGFLLATPEGTMMPAGILAVAGRPDFVPPTRPGTEPPAIPPEIDLARLELAATPMPGAVSPIGGDSGTAGLAVPDPAGLAETAAADTVPTIVTTPTLPIPPDLPPEAIPVRATEPPATPPTRPGTPPSVATAPEQTPSAPVAAEFVAGTPPVQPPTRPAGAAVADAEQPANEAAEPEVRVASGPPPAVPPARSVPAMAATAEPAAARVSAGAPPVVPPARTTAAAPPATAPQALPSLDGPPPAVPPTRAAIVPPEPGPAMQAAVLLDGSPTSAPPARSVALAVAEARVTVAASQPPVVPPQRPIVATAVPAEDAVTIRDGNGDGSAATPPAPAGELPAAAPTLQDAAPAVVPPTRVEAATQPKTEAVVLVAAKPPTVPPGRPAARTQTAAPGGGAPSGLAPSAEETAALAALPRFDGPRPVPRQAGQASAAAPEVLRELPPFDGPRPELRPAGAAPEPNPEPAAEPEPEPEPPPADVNAALAAIVAGAGDPLAGATSAAVSRSVRPDSRPRNFATVVSRARERVARTAPQNTGGAVRQEEEADNEPEVASSAAARPTGPTPGGVAGAATEQNAINLRDVNLIGVYGRPRDRRALIRLANGRYVRVSVGDRLEGGQVTAIGDDALNYVVRGRTYLLQIPEG